MEYALVSLEPNGPNRQTRTDRDGRFSFLGVTPGSRAIRVTFVGYRPNDRTVEVSRGVVDVEIILERVATTLAGVEVTARRSGLYGSVIARDSLLTEAGLDLAIGAQATLGVSYTGQYARNVQDHAAKGKFSWKF